MATHLTPHSLVVILIPVVREADVGRELCTRELLPVVRHANHDRLPAAGQGWARAHQLLSARRTRALGCGEHRGSHGPVAELAREALAVVEVRKGEARDGDVGPARDRATPGVDALDAEILVQVVRECGAGIARLVRVQGLGLGLGLD